MKDKIINELKKNKRTGIEKLIEWLESTDFFTAPASTRFHSNKNGGLAEHSWHVYTLLKEKNERFKLSLSEETVILTGLLHDCCKTNTYSANSKGKYPFIKDDPFPFGHGEKSVLLISKFIDLTVEECLMIRWHQSQGDYEWKRNIDEVSKITSAVMALVTADIEACAFLELTK